MLSQKNKTPSTSSGYIGFSQPQSLHRARLGCRLNQSEQASIEQISKT